VESAVRNAQVGARIRSFGAVGDQNIVPNTRGRSARKKGTVDHAQANLGNGDRVFKDRKAPIAISDKAMAAPGLKGPKTHTIDHWTSRRNELTSELACSKGSLRHSQACIGHSGDGLRKTPATA